MISNVAPSRLKEGRLADEARPRYGDDELRGVLEFRPSGPL